MEVCPSLSPLQFFPSKTCFCTSTAIIETKLLIILIWGVFVYWCSAPNPDWLHLTKFPFCNNHPHHDQVWKNSEDIMMHCLSQKRLFANILIYKCHHFGIKPCWSMVFEVCVELDWINSFSLIKYFCVLLWLFSKSRLSARLLPRNLTAEVNKRLALKTEIEYTYMSSNAECYKSEQRQAHWEQF